MNTLNQKNWVTGAGRKVSLSFILNTIIPQISKGRNIFIGSDSFVSQKKICFVTTVCILRENHGGRYFFYKENTPTRKYNNLSSRITEEVRRSIELAEFFASKGSCNPRLIELHLDVSPRGTNNASSKFSDMLKGYVQGYGFPCKLKPNAWASQTVADRHSK